MEGPGRKPTISDEEILQAFIDASDPVLTTKEVATAVGIGRRGTYERLTELADKGLLETKTAGSTGAVWWHPESLNSHNPDE